MQTYFATMLQVLPTLVIAMVVEERLRPKKERRTREKFRALSLGLSLVAIISCGAMMLAFGFKEHPSSISVNVNAGLVALAFCAAVTYLYMVLLGMDGSYAWNPFAPFRKKRKAD